MVPFSLFSAHVLGCLYVLSNPMSHPGSSSFRYCQPNFHHLSKTDAEILTKPMSCLNKKEAEKLKTFSEGVFRAIIGRRKSSTAGSIAIEPVKATSTLLYFFISFIFFFEFRQWIVAKQER
jgi:hypothetical protein